MSMYEKILDILERKGPATISSIYDELNNDCSDGFNENAYVQLSSIKSAISRKKDLFLVENNVVSILPEKQITQLVIEFQEQTNNWYKFIIDFIQETYIFQEWHRAPKQKSSSGGNIVIGNDFLSLKKEIYKLKIWDLTSNELDEPLNKWTVTLKTVEKEYKIIGIDEKEKNWKRIEKVISPFMDITSIIR
ncbi:MAG: hypothetical protein ABF649_10330 [Bacillus sp. (in: firmicutes)]